MNRRKLLHQATVLTFVVLYLAGCGGVSAGKPQAGATLSGPLEPSRSGKNGTIEGGELSITIADDGTGIASATFSLSNMKCVSGGVTMTSTGQSAKTTFTKPAAIANGKFEFDLGGMEDEIKIVGQFTSPVEANATIEITTRKTITAPGTSMRNSITCDYGAWSWSGKGK